MTVRVRVVDTDRVFDAPQGEDLLEILQRNGYPIATACGGIASCGHCRLLVVAGKELISPIKAEELTHLGNVAKVIGARLACQSQVCAVMGEIQIRVPEVADPEERKKRKAERVRADRRGRDAVKDTAPRPDAGPRATIEWRPARLNPPGVPKGSARDS